MIELAESTIDEPSDVPTSAEALAKLHCKQRATVRSVELRERLVQIGADVEKSIVLCKDPAYESLPATSWILDNDYLIRRALRQLAKDLEGGVDQRLPAVTTPDDRVDIRANILARTILVSSQLQLSRTNIVDFVTQYQQFNPLQHAELWILPTLLRFACLDSLHRSLVEWIPEISEGAQPAIIDRHASVLDAAQTIGQLITSISVLSQIDWCEFVDTVSCLEPVLALDPGKAYPQMDFDTREHYRHEIEKLATHSPLNEIEVAQQAISLCKDKQANQRNRHVGYWLVDKGRTQLACKIEYSAPWREVLVSWCSHHSLGLYGMSIVALMLIFVAIPVFYLFVGKAGFMTFLLAAIVLVIPGSILSLTVVNGLASWLTDPFVLPSLDFSESIPDDCATAIVVPIIVASVAEVDELIDRMETRRLANPSTAFTFVILSDLVDAQQQHLPEDAQIVDALTAGVTALNERHQADGGSFILLHRDRTYNAQEGCWMGWERKRGKLEQFNALVMTGEGQAFGTTSGDLSRLPLCRFAIVLDADTVLPPGTAPRMISTLAHPLNLPVFDKTERRIVDGYAILQPRVELLQESGNRSLFAKLYSGDCSIDIYSRAVSDVYQDLFGTGLFTGKGIYDIASFYQTLHERMPDNSLLSHDLIEGVHTRVALASNIVLYEDFPDTYAEHLFRLQRWIRGDWQLLPWLRSKVPTQSGERLPNPLSRLDKWKVIDNLRRSLISPTVFVLFLLGWFFLPGSPWIWTLLAAGSMASYLINQTFMGLTQGLVRGFSGSLIHQMQLQSGRWLLSITFLVTDALAAIDTIARTVWRVLVSHRHRLQWTSAAHIQRQFGKRSIRRMSWRTMWLSSVIAIITGAVLYLFKPSSLPVALPVLLLWLAAPEVAAWLGKPRTFRREQLNHEQRQFLQLTARRTWHYFDTFCSPEDNWLPPDNFQEDPKGDVAHRTSPTNIGLYQTATLAACDFGFIGPSEFAVRNLRVFDTLDRLVVHRGHLLNWYDTRSLEPLDPQYISTVDNGNLAACLITLKQGSLELTQTPVITPSTWTGLLTTFELLVQATEVLSGSDQVPYQASVDAVKQSISKLTACGPDLLNVFYGLSAKQWPHVELLIDELLGRSDHLSPYDLVELHIWLARFAHQIVVIQRDIDRYYPWLARLDGIPQACQFVRDEICRCISVKCNLSDMQQHTRLVLNVLDSASIELQSDAESAQWLNLLRGSIITAAEHCQRLHDDLLDIADRAHTMAYGMDFKMLYDTTARLFYIGYNLTSARLDENHYDLLASEARLASFFAIAKNDVPIEHWFHLGRPIARHGRNPYLVSWNGSMFEYLMPPLFLPGRRDTLLGESESLAVVQQRHYANKRGVPWGISESAFGVTDADENYQYRAFGTPELGIRRGLIEDLVVAPYATALSLCVWPLASVDNLKRLQALGAQGHYGFIDAVDFTPDRNSGLQVPQSNTEGEEPCILVKTYMAHHQGMTLAAIANALDNDHMVERILREKGDAHSRSAVTGAYSLGRSNRTTPTR